MPSSLIVVALVVAWLVVLVPMIVRKRQEIARTADSALAARVVRKGAAEEADMRETDVADPTEEAGPAPDGIDSTTEQHDPLDIDAEADDRDPVDTDTVSAATHNPAPQQQHRRYRPGRGGFDPEAAALTARARYAARQRVVVVLLLLAVGSAVAAGVLYPMAWIGHGVIDLGLVSYLAYLRRQVRIEEEIRQRRLARMAQTRRAIRPSDQELEYRERERERARLDHDRDYDGDYDHHDERHHPDAPIGHTPPRVTHPHAVVVDIDDEDPAFDELDDPHSLRYRRAVGE
ncbi:gephyrin-like molybdotransferase receptor GlpR [Actinocrispum sp. NPDC049592]|uniref:divisome protein SepX/GlpR n=1 Tax=Actinocrispum sp. NPDC049592 TaxID=3154835 RepID=UPI00341EA8BD